MAKKLLTICVSLMLMICTLAAPLAGATEETAPVDKSPLWEAIQLAENLPAKQLPPMSIPIEPPRVEIDTTFTLTLNSARNVYKDEAAKTVDEDALYGLRRSEAQALSDAISRFQLMAESVKLLVLGDLDSDGQVNTSDARRALQAAVGKITLTGHQSFAADMDKDARVTVSDARMVLQMCVKKLPIMNIYLNEKPTIQLMQIIPDCFI